MDYTERFNRFFDHLCPIEGYRDSDIGRGGDTVLGIARKFHPDEPWPPTKERCKEIYFTEYYTSLHCEDITDIRFAFQFFVAGVNIGVHDAQHHIWNMLCIQNAQIIGPITLDKLNTLFVNENGSGLELSKFVEGMIDHYRDLHLQDPVKYPFDLFVGWLHRLARALAI